MRKEWLVLLVFACSLITPFGVRAQDAATADDREARRQFEAGKRAFDAAKYEEALGNFERAYELSPRPVLLYNIAKSEDNLGQTRDARDHYRRFLAAVPDAPNRDQVERRVAELEIELARQPQVVATPAEAAQTVQEDEPASPLATTPPERSERIHKKWWFWTGLGAVVAGGVAAGIIASTRQSGGGSSDPALLDETTRVREL